MGSIYKRGNVWWIKYYSNGRPIRESSESEKQAVAERLLKQKEGAVANGLPAIPRVDRVSFDEIVKDMLNDYKANAKTSIDDVETSFRLHLTPYFGHRRPARITTADIREYITHRQTQKAANATINRELSHLRRAFSLAIDAAKLMTKPKMPRLGENNVRTGLFEPAMFEAVRSHLPPPVKPVVAELVPFLGGAIRMLDKWDADARFETLEQGVQELQRAIRDARLQAVGDVTLLAWKLVHRWRERQRAPDVREV